MSKRENYRNERKTKSTKRSETSGGMKITIELVAFAVVAIYLAGYTFNMLNKPKIAVETVVYGEIDVPRQFDGIILRDETAAYASESGTVYFSYGENEYVKRDSVVCVIRDEDTSGFEREIEAINESIIDRRAASGSNVETEEIRRLNSKIRNDISKTVPLFIEGDTKELYRFKSSLNSDIETRNSLLLSDTGGALTALIDRKTAFEQKLKDATSTYSANQGGVISYDVDGLESVISPANMMSITEAQIKAHTSAFGGGERQVSAGEPLYKIVNSNTWYMCAYLDAELTLDWAEGASKYIYLSNAPIDRITMKIAAIDRQGEKAYVVFSSSRNLLDFINTRNISFSLEDDTFKGLKIPNTAIVEKTAVLLPAEFIYEFRGSQGVYLKDNNSFEFTPISVLSQADGMARVLQSFGGAKLGVTIYGAEDGRASEDSHFEIEQILTVPGVYVANSGSAEFRQITIIKQNEHYTIIEAGRGYGVKPYDSIITDATTVNDNQIIR